MAITAFAYLGLSALLVGFKTDQVFLVVVFALCYFLTPITRKLILGFSIFIVYWIIFDYMKVVPNYRVNDVHIQSLYEAEKHLFGIRVDGVLLTPNEYWQHFHRSFLDVASGIFYLTWVPVPLGFAAYLFFKNKKEFLYFSLTFLLVNLIGFVIYYVYPAAPPWYVAEHGFTFIRDTPGNTAGLSRFDVFFNTGIFKSIYEKSSNVFAAMPSLHSSYPLIVFYYGLRNRLGAINILFATLMLGIWFSAVYTSHHYVLDVIAGILCAITGIRLFLLMATKNKFIIKILDNYRTVIS
ncbi:phosphatase PAP2 family protein [Rurimicrobium arvi]|uniref:phosphatase PAP2 family protein n=1 Tax=Rurimicrobium arvi TaxID=2049916 RepID=UPI0031CE0068